MSDRPVINIRHRTPVDSERVTCHLAIPPLADDGAADVVNTFAPPAVQRALRLVRDDEVEREPDRLQQLVDAIDRAVTPTSVEQQPQSPYASPLRVGTLERCYDVRGMGTRVAYVYHGLGGEDVVVTLPLRAESDQVVEQITETVNAIRRELEPG